MKKKRDFEIDFQKSYNSLFLAIGVQLMEVLVLLREQRIKYEEDTLLVVGMSRTGDTNPITALYENLVLVFIVERETGKIIDVQFNSVCQITDDFIYSMFIDKNLYEDCDSMCDQIIDRYLGASKKTIVNCIKDAKNKALVHLNRLGKQL